jgi:hypothetical protein
VEAEATDDPLPEAGPVAARGPSPAVSPSPESGEERAGREPGTVAAVEPGRITNAASNTPAQSDGPDEGKLDGPAAQAASNSPDPRELERHTAEQMTAVLISMLDRLGAAHHRPFSRS